MGVDIKWASLGVTPYSGNDPACRAIRTSGPQMVNNRVTGGLPVP
jgi:hypothetical protein